LALAIVSAVVLQTQGVDFFPAVAGVAICVAVNQIAYQIGVVAGPPNRQ
jgi:hypothetical protein